MKLLLITLSLLLSSLASAQAQSMTGTGSLYRALGENAGITRLMDDFVNRVIRDERISGHFKKTKPQLLKDSLSAQICQLSGGPCQYKGPDMKSAHADMDIRKSEFNALVEDLQAAMDTKGISFADQNRLLAILAPMHRDVMAKD